MITAYPIVFIGVLSQTLVMAEMASMYASMPALGFLESND